MKTPKQIHHWAYKAGLRPYRRGTRPKFYAWKGRGRHWRINASGQFQASEPYASFDRWANSVQETWGMPGSEHEFIAIVEGAGV